MSRISISCKLLIGFLALQLTIQSLNEAQAATTNQRRQAKSANMKNGRMVARKPKSSRSHATFDTTNSEMLANYLETGNSSSDPQGEQASNQSGEMSFNLMNSAKDRIEAVRSLLQNQTISASRQTNSSNNLYSGQCTHKGRVYANGHPVPIEDQPCLSCTCSRSIVQCFLRVCPPVVSSESAHRKELDLSSSPAKCRMVKEPNQCCPTMRCEGAEATPSEASSPSQSVVPTSTSLLTSAGIESPKNLPSNSTVTSNIPSNSSSTTQDSVHNSYKPSNESTATSHPPVEGTLKDSVLLISSNPVHHSQHAINTSVTSKQQKPMSRYDFSSSVLDSLIESVYSTAAQMNGLNVHGSCLINGSLYVEGSAVLTEANSFCQYCYCIRQKIMCVRPKCHLYVSGCKPKYGSEYACCPTSYECSSSPLGFQHIEGLNSLPTGPSRSTGPKEFLGKIGVALESLARLSELERLNAKSSSRSSDQTETTLNNNLTRTNPEDSTDNLMSAIVRTVDEVNGNLASRKNSHGDQNSDSSSVGADQSSYGDSSNSTSISPKEVSSTTSSPTTNSSTTTDSEVSERTYNKRTEMDSGEYKLKENRNLTSTISPAIITTSDELLEPMNKLGPLMTLAQMGGAGGCLENGRNYEIGEQIPTLDRCKHCYCGLEGMKECKIVECSLKMAHDCRPVIPKDHCCPIRYECPPSSGGQNPIRTNQYNQAHFNQNSTQLAQRNNLADSLREAMNRYRSENLADGNSTQPENSSSFSPCSPSSDNCSMLTNTVNQPLAPQTQNQSTPPRMSPPSPANAVRNAASGIPFNWPVPTGPLELIPGLGDYAPSVETVPYRSAGEPRFLENGPEISSTVEPPLTVTGLNKMLEFFTKTEMDGNGFQSAATQSPPSLTTGQTLNGMVTNVGELGHNNSINPNGMQNVRTQVRPLPPTMTNLENDLNKFIMNISLQQQNGNSSNESSRLMMSPLAVNNQQPRMAADYHKVQTDSDQASHNSMLIDNSDMPNAQPLAIGIPSIEPELIGNLPKLDDLALVNRSDDITPEVDRDEKRDDVAGSNANNIQHARLTESSVEYAASPSWQRDSRSAMPQATNSNLSGNHIANHKPRRELSEFRDSDIPELTTDDYLDVTNDANKFSGLTNGGSHGPRIRFPVSTPRETMTSVNLALGDPSITPSSISNDRSGVIFDDEAAHNSHNSSLGSTSTVETIPNANRRLDQATSVVMSDNNTDGTLFLAQPNNGTPFGITEPPTTELPREKKWYDSLGGLVVSHFGRRLGAGRATNEKFEPLYAESSQSTGPVTIFKKLFDRIVGNPAESQITGRSLNGGSEPQQLIMRPMRNLSPLSSVPYLLNGQPTPDVIGNSEIARINLDAKSTAIPLDQFSRRNDMGSTSEEEPEEIIASSEMQSKTEAINSMRMNENHWAESVSHQGENSQPMIGSDARLALTCFDPHTNTTYQSGEKMTKNDSCMACTCVSGEPLCSPLVCPPKPAENCYEDRAAHVGECCRSYVCADNVSHLGSNYVPISPSPETPRPNAIDLENKSQIVSQAKANDMQKQHTGRMMVQDLNRNVHQNKWITQPADTRPPNLQNQMPPKLELHQQSNNMINTRVISNSKAPEFNTANNLNRNSFSIDQKNKQPIVINNYNQNRNYPPTLNMPISTSNLFNSLPAHLRYPPQKNAPILPNIISTATMSPTSTSLATFETQNNQLASKPLDRVAIGKISSPSRPIDTLRTRNPVLTLDSRPNVQVVTHPARRIIPDMGSYSTMLDNNMADQRSVRWDRFAMQQTSAPLQTMTPIGKDSTFVNQLGGRSETLVTRPNEPQKPETHQLKFSTEMNKFSQAASPVDPSAFRPVAGPNPVTSSGIFNSNFTKPTISSMSEGTIDDGSDNSSDTNISSNEEQRKNHSIDDKQASPTTVQSTMNLGANDGIMGDNPFQVSKCDVSGRLYDIGEMIESLSNRCKHCICTPIGVDCQTRLC